MGCVIDGFELFLKWQWVAWTNRVGKAVPTTRVSTHQPVILRNEANIIHVASKKKKKNSEGT